MPTGTQVKPTHKPIKEYYAALQRYAGQKVAHEGALRSAFQNLLADTGRRFGWTLIPELTIDANGQTIRPDGTFRDEYTIERGYWEAKDTDDDLETEIKKKIKRGYRLTNSIFEDTREARLYQDGKLTLVADLGKTQQLCDLLNTFFAHTEPAHEDFSKAVDEFKQRVPDLARGLVELIQQAHENNPRFIAAFDKFYDLCKQSLNPNLSSAAVDEMLVQHLLTERLIRTVFDSQDFTRRNVIAAEIEKVIDALVSQSFNRHDYLKRLDRFYVAIEEAARTISGFAEKQHFLNVVYERFFQGYSVKVADTHGIIYTPQEIVDFMCASVAEVLEQEFGKKLGDPGVNILDPCTGTGNFIVNLIRRIPKRDLPRMYREQLFANEVMLLPYYIAALNIEHAYYEKMGQYEPFAGMCFVDTLDLAEGPQQTFGFMAEENVQRVERQRKTPITVILGNPPYNAHQINENDNNKNREYAVVDARVSNTYAKDSTAKNKNALRDPYVKFFRWATDRLEGRDGIVCFVSNNSFIDQIAFDGMRKNLLQDFTRVYHIHLEGNVRHNPTLSGTTYNVFGIQVGVGITVAIRAKRRGASELQFQRVEKTLRREKKLAWLSQNERVGRVNWERLVPDARCNWIRPEEADRFARFMPLGGKRSQSSVDHASRPVFEVSSVGLKTNRDNVVYDFDPGRLHDRVARFAEAYNGEVDRWKRAGGKQPIDEFVQYRQIKWSESLKANAERGRYASIALSDLRRCLYRPYAKRHVCFNDVLVERRYQLPQVFPTQSAEEENQVIAATDLGSEKPFMALVAATLADIHVVGAGASAQCFPFYVYDEDGTNRRENVTDWALAHFRAHYGDQSIGKWDIFYYVYGVLHHPGYREKFADNLKRELPRIPLAPPCDPSPDREQSRDRERADRPREGAGRYRRPGRSPAATNHTADEPSAATGFWAFAEPGRELAELHIGYESLEPWPLDWVETPGEPLSYHVEKMRLSKDKKSLKVNDSLTLGKIPPEVFDYRLGNRSALEWVIDQYRVKEDQPSGIRSDPNNPDDPQYIVRLVGQVVRVSVETVRIVNNLPEHYAPPPQPDP